MGLQRLKFLSGILAVAALGGIAALGGADLLARPPKPSTIIDWLQFLVLLGLLGIALILAFVIGGPLLRGGYPKPHAARLPVQPLRWGGFVLVLTSLCLFRFGYLDGRDVVYFAPLAAQTLWLSYHQNDELAERDA